MKVNDALLQVTERLAMAGLDDPLMESEFLVASVLGISRTHLFLKKQMELASDEAKRILEGAARREQRQPLAYALGLQPFGELELAVSPAVLVPRPETEILVEKIMASMDELGASLMIADVGTGSGAIALSLAQHKNVKTVYGIDLSEDALTIARKNAERYDAAARCRWRCGDLLNALQDNDSKLFDLIVANLPYIRRSELASLAPELHHEPQLALDGGPSGLDVIFRLVDQAPAFLRHGGTLWLEVGYDQAEMVRLYFGVAPAWDAVHIYEDLSGIPRIVCARRKDH